MRPSCCRRADRRRCGVPRPRRTGAAGRWFGAGVDASQPIRFRVDQYKTEFGEDSTACSRDGYLIIDALPKATRWAGPGLSTDGFIEAMDTQVIEPDRFGWPRVSGRATKRLGNDLSRLSQTQDGRGMVVSAYTEP